VEELDIYRKIIDTPLMFRVLKLEIIIDAKNSILTKVNDTRISRLIGRLGNAVHEPLRCMDDSDRHDRD
jgi:hypothetical protein